MTRRIPLRALYSLFLIAQMLPALAASPPLVVVEDRGGTSALPYYQALNPQAHEDAAAPTLPAAPPPARPVTEAVMLPVRSPALSPGDVPQRVIRAPGLRPLFLVGDDPRSRAWLRARLPILRDLGAMGLVVQVETPAALAELRALAPGLTLSPMSGDDLAARLGLRHYPVLVTATGVEQ